MEEEALNDAHKLFIETGYKGDVNKFKSLISSNKEALNDAYKLFVDTGYKGDISKFSTLVGVSEKKNQVANGGSTSKAIPSASTSKVTPITSLGGEKTQAVKASGTSVGGKMAEFKGFSVDEQAKMQGKETPSKKKPELAIKNPLMDKRLKLKKDIAKTKITTENIDEMNQKVSELEQIQTQDSLNKAKPMSQEDTGFLGYAEAEATTGLLGVAKALVKDVPEFIYDLNQAASRKISDALGIEQGISKYNAKDVLGALGINNEVADSLDTVIKSSNDKIEAYNQKNGGDVLTALSNGNYLGAAKMTAGATLQSAPLMLAAMFTGGGTAALATIGTVSGAMTYGELQEKSPEMDKDVQLASSVASGLLEGFLGKFFSGTSGAVAKRILAEKGVEAGSRVLAKGFKGIAMEAMEKNPVVGLVGEIVEEGSVEFGNQLIAISNGTRSEFDMRQVYNAGLSATGMGVINTVAVYGAKGYVKASDYKKTKAVNKEIASLSSELSNPNLSDSDKKILSSRVDKLILENKKTIGDGLNNIKALPNDVKTEIVDINNQLEDLRDKVIEIEDNSVMSPNVKDALITEIKSSVKELTDRKLKIIDGNYIYDDFNKLSETEKIDRKDKASRELLNEAQAKGEEKASFDDAQITKKAVEDYGNERKQRSDREATDKKEPTGDQAVSEYQQPTKEGREGVRGVQEEVKPTEAKGTPDVVSQQIDLTVPSKTVEAEVKPTANNFDLLGDKKAQWMEVIPLSELKAHKTGYSSSNIYSIENALLPRKVKGKNTGSLFDRAVSEGRITPEEAIKVINSAGIEAPESIKKLVKPTEPTVIETPIVETPKESKARQTLVDKTKNAEAELKDAWKNLSNLGAIYDPKVQAEKQVAMNKAILKYVVNKIALGAYDVNAFVKDMASNGIELTKEGADFLFDKSQKAYGRQIAKLTGVTRKPVVGARKTQKDINMAYAIGKGESRKETAEAKAETQEVKSKLKQTKEELQDTKNQLKSVFEASLEAVKQVRNRADKNKKIQFEIGGAIESLKGKGKITQTQAGIISKKLVALDVEDLDAVEAFMNDVDDVFKRVDFYEKVNTAKKTAKALKTASNNKEKDNTLRAVAKELALLNPSNLDAEKTLGKDSDINISIDEHTEMLDKVIEGLRQTTKTTKAGGNTLIRRKPFNVTEVLDYIDKFKALELKQAKTKYEEVFNAEPSADLTSEDMNAKISEYNALKATYKRLMKASNPDMNAKEIKALNNKVNSMSPESLSDFLFKEDDVDSESEFAKRHNREALSMLADAQSRASKTRINNIHPLSGERFTTEEEDIIDASIDSSKLDMTTKQILDLSNKLDNFAENGVIGGLGAFMAKAKSAKNKNILAKKNIEGFRFKRYFRKDIGAAMGKYLSSPRMLVDEIFRGKSKGDLVWKASGMQEFENGTAKGIKLAKNVLDKFDEVKNRAGKEFMDANNVYERGMLAHVMRDVGDSKEARDKNFLKVKSWMEQSIDNLLNSEDKVEVEKGEVYRAVYDKILKDSNSITEVVNKSDKHNIEAVGVYQEANNLEHSKTKFTKDAYYNEGMRKDEGYAFPVKYGVIDASKSIDVVDSSLGKGNTTNLRQKTTSMNDDTRANKLNDNYIDLDFDRIAHQEFEKVAIANRALPFAFQYKAFRDMGGFKDLIKDKGTRDMLTSVLEDYIVESQGVSVGKYDREISGLAKILSPFRKAGTTMALVSLTAPIKQSLPMIPSTLINSGRFDFSLAVNKDYKEFLDKSGSSTANRGLGSLTMFDSAASSLKANKKSWFGRRRQDVGNAQDKSLKAAVGFADSEIAKISWGSYYQQKAGKVKDWKSHRLNQEAANYADSMISSDQGGSDPNMVGKAFKAKGLEGELLKTVLMFARFKVNMASNISKNAVIAFSKHTNNQDRKLALRGLAGSASQAATFGALSTIITLTTAAIANNLFGDDKEEGDKERYAQLASEGELDKLNLLKKHNEALKDKELQEVYLGLVNRFSVDMLSPIPVTDSLITTLMSSITDNLNSDSIANYKPEIKVYSNDKWYSGFGPIGVMVDKLYKTYDAVITAKSGIVEGKKDSVQTITAQESVFTNYIFPTVLVISALTGLGLSDVNNLFAKSIKQTPETIKGFKLAYGKKEDVVKTKARKSIIEKSKKDMDKSKEEKRKWYEFIGKK